VRHFIGSQKKDLTLSIPSRLWARFEEEDLLNYLAIRLLILGDYHGQSEVGLAILGSIRGFWKDQSTLSY
jgi:hypothetical protein